MVKVWKLCIMPDHIHMIVAIDTPMSPKHHLGTVVSGFKAGCTRAWWNLSKLAGEPARTVASWAVTVPEGSPEGKLPLLFENGYNDKILLEKGQLGRWKHYLDDNPRRLMLKRKHPDLFTVMHNVAIAGRSCQAVGNRFLLDIPEKAAVIVHRRYTSDEFLALRDLWLSTGENGGVLVSAAIAPREKEVMREAMDRGYSIILLRENGFPALYKPVGEKFDACSRGQLLEISPWQYHMEQQQISRNQCLELNTLAQLIVQE